LKTIAEMSNSLQANSSANIVAVPVPSPPSVNTRIIASAPTDAQAANTNQQVALVVSSDAKQILSSTPASAPIASAPNASNESVQLPHMTSPQFLNNSVSADAVEGAAPMQRTSTFKQPQTLDPNSPKQAQQIQQQQAAMAESGQLPPGQQQFLDPTTGQPWNLAPGQHQQGSVMYQPIMQQPQQMQQQQQQPQQIASQPPPAYEMNGQQPQSQQQMQQQQIVYLAPQPVMYVQPQGEQQQQQYMMIPRLFAPVISQNTRTVMAVPDQAMTSNVMTQEEANKRGINTQVDVVGGGKVGDTAFEVTEQGVETYDKSLVDMPSILNFLTAHASKCGAKAHIKGTHIEHYTTRDSNGSVFNTQFANPINDFNHFVCVSEFNLSHTTMIRK
jgi:hypothetical protein